jgi:phosphotransferase family enzyme
VTRSSFSNQLSARQSLILDRLLELLSPASTLVKMENPVLEPIPELCDCMRLFRLRFNQPNGSPRSFVVKTVKAHEYAIHRLLSTQVSGATPRVFGGGRVGADLTTEWLLVMEDFALGPLVWIAPDEPLPSSKPAPAASALLLSSFQEALRLLAIIHARFLDRRSELETCGVRPVHIDPVALSESVPATCSLLTLCKTLLGLPLEAPMITEIKRIGVHLALMLKPLQMDACWTLVHGDFHFGNLLRDSSGNIRIADWGSAAIQSPAWDLVLCSETEVAYYVEVMGRCAHICRNEPEFFSQLRAAVIYRMYVFIQSAIVSVLNGRSPWMAPALPICMQRFIEVASSGCFRGGNAVRFLTSTVHRSSYPSHSEDKQG